MTSNAAGPRRRSDAEPLAMDAFHCESRARRKLPDLRHHWEKRGQWRSEKTAIRSLERQIAARVGKKRYFRDCTHIHPCLNRPMSSIIIRTFEATSLIISYIKPGQGRARRRGGGRILTIACLLDREASLQR